MIDFLPAATRRAAASWLRGTNERAHEFVGNNRCDGVYVHALIREECSSVFNVIHSCRFDFDSGKIQCGRGSGQFESRSMLLADKEQSYLGIPDSGVSCLPGCRRIAW